MKINPKMMEYGLMRDMEARAKFAAGQPPAMMRAMANDGGFITEIRSKKQSKKGTSTSVSRRASVAVVFDKQDESDSGSADSFVTD